MNGKLCDKCNQYYDNNLSECPNCSSQNSGFNIANPFLAMSTNNQNGPIENAPVSPTPLTNITSETIVNNSSSGLIQDTGLITNEPKQDENMDKVLGINGTAETPVEPTIPDNDLDKILGLNGSSNNQETTQPVETKVEPTQEENNLDSILGLNGKAKEDTTTTIKSIEQKEQPIDNNNQEKQKPDKLAKATKNIKNDLIIITILEVFVIGYTLSNPKIEINIFSIVFLCLSIVGLYFAVDGKKPAAYIAMVIGLFMMLTIIVLDIIDFVLGLFMVLHCINYLIQNKKKQKMELSQAKG